MSHQYYKSVTFLRTITLICTRSKKQHVVMRAKLTAFTFSESVGNGTEVKNFVFFFCILMRPAISFLKSKNFQLFVKKKFSLLYPDRGIYPDRYLSPACWSQVAKFEKGLECLSCSSDAENIRSAGLFWLNFIRTSINHEIYLRNKNEKQCIIAE